MSYQNPQRGGKKNLILLVGMVNDQSTIYVNVPPGREKMGQCATLTVKELKALKEILSGMELYKTHIEKANLY